MESPEALTGIERELEGGLLSDNYECLTEESGERCTELVLEYIRRTETVLDKDIIFIKRLTKVAHHIQQSSDSLDDLLIKLYKFNMEGVEILRRGTEEFAGNNLRRINLGSHLLAYAGDAAKAIFEKVRDVSWAKKWYECSKTSADMAKDTDPRHSAHTYGFAGEAAKAIFEKVRDVSWAKKWYKCYKASADMAKDTDPRHSAHAYSFAGNAAEAISRITNDKSWDRAAIDCYSNFLRYHKDNPNPQMSNLICRIEGAVSFLQRFV